MKLYGTKQVKVEAVSNQKVDVGDGYDLLEISPTVILRSGDEYLCQYADLSLAKAWQPLLFGNSSLFSTQSFCEKYTDVIAIRRKKQIIPKVGDVWFYADDPKKLFLRISDERFIAKPTNELVSLKGQYFYSILLSDGKICMNYFSDKQMQNVIILFKKEKYLRLINEG